MAIMTVYHGGYQVVEQPEIRKRCNTKDFVKVQISNAPDCILHKGIIEVSAMSLLSNRE